MTQDEIQKLKALALAATPGPWFYQEDADAYTHIVRPENRPGHIVRQYAQDTSGQVEADARFTAAANPDAIRSLIAQLEARPAVVDAPTGKLTKAEARKILDLALDLEKTGRICSLTQGQERTDFVARNRNIQCALTDILDMLTEPAAPPSPAVEAPSEGLGVAYADAVAHIEQLTAELMGYRSQAGAVEAVIERDEILALMDEMSKHPQLKPVIGREALILRCVRAALSQKGAKQ